MGFTKPISKKFDIHPCGPLSPTSECREYGVSRLHINTPWVHISFPYWPLNWWPNADLVKKFGLEPID